MNQSGRGEEREREGEEKRGRDGGRVGEKRGREGGRVGEEKRGREGGREGGRVGEEKRGEGGSINTQLTEMEN